MLLPGNPPPTPITNPAQPHRPDIFVFGKGTVDLNTLLPGPNDPLRPVVLYELVKIDMEFRWQRGEMITLEHYLATYPELGPAAELSPHLIFEEYRLSQQHGANTSLSVYRKR